MQFEKPDSFTRLQPKLLDFTNRLTSLVVEMRETVESFKLGQYTRLSVILSTIIKEDHCRTRETAHEIQLTNDLMQARQKLIHALI